MAIEPRRLVEIPVGDVKLPGELRIPDDATGLVVFAHGSGSSRRSPRNNAVADKLREHGLGTLLFDLLTPEEDIDNEARFDIALLTDRLVATTDWLADHDDAGGLPVGYFGSSTGAAAALRAAARRPEVAAIVSRGGRVDMAAEAVPDVTAPTLLIVGGEDEQVHRLNQEIFEQLDCDKELAVVPKAGHLFQGPGQLEEVTALAMSWFDRHFA
ncbi:dienelactone hydrolase family protein [Haloarchaeobius amylolyticus]|uniref:dienelactone hydrolase family protein n=1 Tax=Haloarchaeobius amylolyticus TaxID=1198296 RepID=UPI00226F8022|nr:dienelactone hydrolase family protein [Haloarchaeobius amylolyticus]